MLLSYLLMESGNILLLMISFLATKTNLFLLSLTVAKFGLCYFKNVLPRYLDLIVIFNLEVQYKVRALSGAPADSISVESKMI